MISLLAIFVVLVFIILKNPLGHLLVIDDMAVLILCAAVLFSVVKKLRRRWIIIMGIIVPCTFVMFLVAGRELISDVDLVIYIFLFGILITALYALPFIHQT